MRICRHLLSPKAVALDIDGVLLRGGKPLPRAADALNLLRASKIPYVFVTNGGGMTEEEKSVELQKKLHTVVKPEQVILSHTPFKYIANQYKNDRVLILGHKGCMQVAESYGFLKPVNCHQILEEIPTVYPLSLRTGDRTETDTDTKIAPISTKHVEKVKAIFIFHDPINWGLEMQIMSDIVLDKLYHNNDITTANDSNDNQQNMNDSIPIYVSNADIVYTSDHFFPRYTQGAFIEAFKALFNIYTNSGTKLNIIYCGKPFNVQYTAAEKVLHTMNSMEVITQYYGVGDNPKSDIRGANNAGSEWKSILVKTGVFEGDKNDIIDPADVIVGDVYDAIQYIINDKL